MEHFNTTAATCADCDQSFEIDGDAMRVFCCAHDKRMAACHPATCAHFAPRKMLTQSSVTEIWHEPRG